MLAQNIIIDSDSIYSQIANSDGHPVCQMNNSVYKILISIDDGSIEFLNNTAYWTKTVDGSYNVYTKVS